MQAIILAGGKGTRLKPYTTILPKPLVPVGEYPILEIVVRQLKHAGFSEVIISTGYLAQLIEAYFGNGKKWDIDIKYVCEEKPLNTAGALKLIKNLKDNFLVMNGDILTDMNFAEIMRLHLKNRPHATIATARRKMHSEFGVLEIDSSGFLKNYTEKPIHQYIVSTGVYTLSRVTVDLIQNNEVIGMPELFIRLISEGKKVLCHESEASWLDIGRVQDFEMAQEEFAQNKRKYLLNVD